MNLSDLLDSEDMDRIEAARAEDYLARAASFLHRHFAPTITQLSANQIRDAILDAAEEARQIGLSSEKDHLNHLIARVFLGRRFVLNPALYTPLYNAGWIEDDGRPARVFSFAPLFEQIDAREQVLAADLASSHRLIQRIGVLYQPNPPQGIIALATVLPSLTATLRRSEAEALANIVDAHAIELGLTGADRDTFLCMTALLGIELHRDPFHVPIIRALTHHPAGSDEQRMAALQALCALMQVRSTAKPEV